MKRSAPAQKRIAELLKNRRLHYLQSFAKLSPSSYSLRSQLPSTIHTERGSLEGIVRWVELPKNVNTTNLHQRALERNISLALGLAFSATQAYRNFLRIKLTAASDGVTRSRGFDRGGMASPWRASARPDEGKLLHPLSGLRVAFLRAGDPPSHFRTTSQTFARRDFPLGPST
jgi:hypothetical protein